MSSMYDRAAEDVGNLIALEHVNVAVPDQRLATVFYVLGMGFTRDPYLSVGDENMWINLGAQQFHLPTQARAQVLRGHVGIVVPDLDELEARLAGVRPKLLETRFAFGQHDGHLDITCPWGNAFRCHAPQARFGETRLGMPYVKFTVPRGTAPGIVRFYQRAFGVTGTLSAGDTHATIALGRGQWLAFREADAEPPPYDGHHIAVYVADFSSPHRFLTQHSLITEESDAHQYRFEYIVDPESGAPLFQIQHEVRSLKHPMWGRPLVNRNPAQRQRGYKPGRDEFYG